MHVPQKTSQVNLFDVRHYILLVLLKNGTKMWLMCSHVPLLEGESRIRAAHNRV